jgi:hypothetical protein
MNKSTPKPNAFTLVQPVRIRPTQVSKALATRINKNTCATAWCKTTKGERAPR